LRVEGSELGARSSELRAHSRCGAKGLGFMGSSELLHSAESQQVPGLGFGVGFGFRVSDQGFGFRV